MVKKKQTKQELDINDKLEIVMGYSFQQAIDELACLTGVETPSVEDIQLIGAVKLQLRILAGDQSKYLGWIK